MRTQTQTQDIITNLRNIVTSRTASRINGSLVDTTSAFAVLKVYDSLKSETAKEKYSKMSIQKMVDVAWTLLR